MYVSGLVQGLMWKEFNADGTLMYGNFLETVLELIPMYWMRAFGGSLYVIGMIILIYNVLITIRKSNNKVEDDLAEAVSLSKISNKRIKGETFHHWLERKPIKLTILATITILIGGAVQIIPTLKIDSNIPIIESVKPYTALELEGRDIYIREGCVSCHSQMIRPFRSEVERYGDYSKAGEFVYDHPFLWGSKRTGPDLHRIGGKYSDIWHFNHMLNPQSISSGSIMPSYPWLIYDELDKTYTQSKMRVMVSLGVPYSEKDIIESKNSMEEQGIKIENNLLENPDFKKMYLSEKNKMKEDFIEIKNREITALIAYIQRLGTDIKIK